MRLTIKSKVQSARAVRARLAAMGHGRTGFTLAELLVVIAIIALIATISIPAMRGLMETNAMSGATRQMLDDVGYARQKAINSRTKVYMVFIPPEFWTNHVVSSFNQDSRIQLTNLVKGQCTTYALYSEKGIGEQPGRVSPQYLTAWKSLPEGVIIDTNMFSLLTNDVERIVDLYPTTIPVDQRRRFEVRVFQRREFPFPPTEVTNSVPAKFSLPYIAFLPNGQLETSRDFEYIPLAKGSVFYARKNGKPDFDTPDITMPAYRETTRTNFNLVQIDSLTGRARMQKLEIQ